MLSVLISGCVGPQAYAQAPGAGAWRGARGEVTRVACRVHLSDEFVGSMHEPTGRRCCLFPFRRTYSRVPRPRRNVIRSAQGFN
ncbi:MAG: hypothetical protein EOO60_06535 [Hymenobacter sp.]|nr:MAG: hypothetical protein EOO60_06535 [Hymenobacter sp.]